MAGSRQEWKLAYMVRSYHIHVHVHKDVGHPYLENEFTMKHQKNNPHNKYTITLILVDIEDEIVVGGICQERFLRSATCSFTMGAQLLVLLKPEDAKPWNLGVG